MTGVWSTSLEIALMWLSLMWLWPHWSDDKSTSVQVLVWCCQATGHCQCQCWSSSMRSYCRSQWAQGGLPILNSKHHGWWWPSSTRRWGISWHDNYLIYLEPYRTCPVSGQHSLVDWYPERSPWPFCVMQLKCIPTPKPISNCKHTGAYSAL